MTGLEALNDLIEDLQQDNGVSIICKEKIENELKALEIIKKFIWVEDGKLKCGRYADIEIEFEEEDFESKEQYDLLKEVLE